MGRGISAGTMGIVILAILAGLVGAYIVRSSLIRLPEPEPAKPAVRSVPLASSDLKPGSTITLGDVSLHAMTDEQMRTNGIGPTAMMDPDQIIGRTLRESLPQGKPFLTTTLYREGERPDYLSELLPGQRAFSLPVPKDRGGSLPSGSIVDVLFRATERPGTPTRLAIPEVTVELLRGIKIIDVFHPPVPRRQASNVMDITQRYVSRTPPPPTVTLAVTPEQAEAIQATMGRGEMTLVAKRSTDRLASADRRRPVTLADVLGIEPPPPTILFATEIYRRGARSVNVFRDDKLVEQMRAAAQDQPPAAPPAPQPPPAAPPPPAPSGAGTLQPTIPVAPVTPVTPGVPVVPVPVPVIP